LSRASKHHPQRFGLMSLHARHFEAVRPFANTDATLAQIHQDCLRLYDHLFGRLRSSQRDAQPSDELCKEIIVSIFVGLVRDERCHMGRIAHRAAN
jgi:hypothetical protein